MSMILRRTALGLVSVAAIVAVTAMFSQQAETPTYTFRVTLGLTDKEPTDWSGKITVAAGEVIELTGWRFEEKDKIEDKSAWKCSTHRFIDPEARYPVATPGQEGIPPHTPEKPWANGVTLVIKGQAPTVTLALPNGELKFKTSDIPLGGRSCLWTSRSASSEQSGDSGCYGNQLLRSATASKTTSPPSGSATAP